MKRSSMPLRSTPMKRGGAISSIDREASKKAGHLVLSKPKKKPAKKRGPSTAALKRKATVLHSQYVRARDGGCVRCRITGAVPSSKLECSHFVSRRYTATRTKEWNACALCSACHRFLTEHPEAAVAWAYQWCKDYGAYPIDEVRRIAYEGKDSVMRAEFWEEEIRRLTALLEDVNRHG